MYFSTRVPRARSRRANQFTPVNALLNGALQALADIALQPVILLAAIAYLLGGSSYQIAGFAVVSLASWALAEWVAAPLRVILRRDFRLVTISSVIRLVAAVAIGVIGLRLADADARDQVGALLVAYTIYQLASAVIGRASVHSIQGGGALGSRRGLFRSRAIIGAAAALIGGVAVWSALRAPGTTGDQGGLALVLAAIGIAAATWFLLAIPGNRRIEPRAPHRGRSAREGLPALRFRAYRHYLFFRSVLALSAAADPFLIVFGLVQLGLTLGEVGAAIAVYAAGHLLGMLIWPEWTAARGARAPLQMTALLRLLILVVAVSIPSISASGLYAGRFDGPDVAVRCFIAIFGLLGLVTSANNVANQPYLLDIVPADLAHPAIALTNTILGGLALGALAAAFLVERFSLQAMLYVAIILAFVALVGSGLLADSRIRIRQRYGSRGVRRPIARGLV